MKKLFTILSLLLSISLFSQENNANIWYFGENAGVDFNTGIPQSITDGALNTWEGCASICNQQGELMFYTDGQKIYNSNHQIMPNGDGLLGDYSASQSSIIIPKPDFSPINNLYYVFTVDRWQDDFANGLRYSIVDMSLNNGLGDVTSDKNILLHDKVAEKITAIHHSNNQDVWILTHDWGSNDYLAYKLTADSIFTTPIVSSYGYNYTGDYSLGAGQLRFSKDGSYFVSTMNYIHRFELFKFNKTTGELYDMLEFQDSNSLLRAWGAEFSRDERLLYISKRPPEILLQFDLENWDYNSVINSAYSVETTSGSTDDYDAGTLQMGPNGKIYLTRYDQTYISVVNNPNNIGNTCGFEEIGVDLNGQLCKWGLPNLFYFKGFQFFTGSEIDTIICEGDSIYLENSYQTVEETYYDTVNSYLGWDSIINTNLSVLSILQIPSITENSGVLTSSSSINYQWFFNGNIISGATTQNYQPFVTGTYQVVVTNTNDCESWSDEYDFVYVGINDELENDFEIYPNPTNNILSVKGNIFFEIIILDFKGQEVLIDNTKTIRKKVNMTQIDRGVYLLKIITDKTTLTRKIIKQ